MNLNSGLKDVHINDKYTVEDGRIFVTGIQALVRLPMLQHQRDLAAGYSTAGYITGYRGSPLGGLDLQIQRAQKFLEPHNINFVAAVNEDLAATALWGTQQAQLDDDSRFDGVFGMWYGKGPGVDRSGDALRHANLAGTSALGGVLALMGDDHTCESSTTSHQSEFAMVDAMIPILNPAGVQDIIDFGLYGWALSRFSGCWIGLKCVHDTVEATASIDISPARVDIRYPEGINLPENGVNIRWPDTPQEQEKRLHEYKHIAVQAFVRANQLDQIIFNSDAAKIGIITTGKSYLDVRQALAELNIDEQKASNLGLRLYKIAMPYPLEPLGVKSFCKGLQRVVVVEEKRGLIEDQLKSIVYNEPNTPVVVGKYDLNGERLFPSAGRLDTNHIAAKLGQHILAVNPNQALKEQLGKFCQHLEQSNTTVSSPMLRTPYFCAGCPHNTSTQLPEGSKAMAGIGCHYMVQWMDRNTQRFTHMGAEGASWIGQQPFSQTEHIFQNMGDGTYFHSGYMAIRAAIAANTNITFKILYNDAVAMTGGQEMDGPLSPTQVAWQVYAEGAKRIALLAEDPKEIETPLPPKASLHHRDELNDIQRELRQIKGTSIIIYHQTCAAEKRRRRKRGLYPDPAKRLFIFDAVCEGCGDCGTESNCVAILPKETQFGRKREIDQSACNKDYTCTKGFCPSFVTVHGGRIKKGASDAKTLDQSLSTLVEPELPTIEKTFNILLTGVGGTGVVTIGAILGMATHISNKGCSILDMMGLAQKGGAVMSHIILGNSPSDITATHIPTLAADLILGCDMVVAASPNAISRCSKARSFAVINNFEMMTGDFTRDPDKVFPKDAIEDVIQQHISKENILFVNATKLATHLLGDSIGANMFLLGVAYQKGKIPLPAVAIEKAIELNGQSVEMNVRSFRLGRLYVSNPGKLDKWTKPAKTINNEPEILNDVLNLRTQALTEYQDRKYADQYTDLISRVQQRERQEMGQAENLSIAAAKHLYSVMAYKDEYEVARLFCNPKFKDAVSETFEGDYKLGFNLAPPVFARTDKRTGKPRKVYFGSWILILFKVLKNFKFLRQTKLDIFGYSQERKCERQMIIDYMNDIEWIIDNLTSDNYELVEKLVSWPSTVKGFGHVKLSYLAQAVSYRNQLHSSLSIPHST